MSEKDWPCRSPQRVRRNYLKSKYAMTVGEYDALLAEQGGVCAICSRPPKTDRLAIDHSHRTGIVRGLLCPMCNRGLEWFRLNPDILRSAAQYVTLREW